MAKISAYTCDGCETILTEESRTRMTIRYERADGGWPTGEVVTDMCLDCAQAPVQSDLSPIRRRKSIVREEASSDRPEVIAG